MWSFTLTNRGGRQSFSHAKGGGGTTCFGEVFTQKLEVLVILKGGRKTFPLFKEGAKRVLPCLEGGTQKVSDLRFSHL